MPKTERDTNKNINLSKDYKNKSEISQKNIKEEIIDENDYSDSGFEDDFNDETEKKCLICSIF